MAQGFAAGALIFTARNFTLSRGALEETRRTVELTRQTVKLTEQGQVTDRYTKAIEQLGSDKLDVRIGGIYALERVAADSMRDYPTIMEVLCAFIRVHSHELRTEAAGEVDPRGPKPRSDIQAALTVIGRRNPEHDEPGAWSTCLLRTSLERRWASRTSLTLSSSGRTSRAMLAGADLSGANLNEANLEMTFFTNANLTGAYLNGANLTSASSGFYANLIGAKLEGANLTRAHLTDAVLTDASLDGADLTGAWVGSSAAVPTGWIRDPRRTS